MRRLDSRSTAVKRSWLSLHELDVEHPAIQRSPRDLHVPGLAILRQPSARLAEGIRNTRDGGIYLFPVPSSLETALAHVLRLDAAPDKTRTRAEAMQILEDALETDGNDAPAIRFKALLLRAELAADSGDLIAARGWLAEARQVRVSAEAREALPTEMRRADDLEAFLTHRGCAG